MAITFRKATMSDLELLRSWDQEEHVIASNPNEDWDWHDDLSEEYSWRQQLIALIDGRPLGFLQIIDPHKEITRYWGEVPPGKRAIDIWIGNRQDLGKGYGTTMMTMALEICFADPLVDEVLIDPLASNERAIRFYQRLGFRFVEKRWFGPDLCDVHAITRHIWKKRTQLI